MERYTERYFLCCETADKKKYYAFQDKKKIIKKKLWEFTHNSGCPSIEEELRAEDSLKETIKKMVPSEEISSLYKPIDAPVIFDKDYSKEEINNVLDQQIKNEYKHRAFALWQHIVGYRMYFSGDSKAYRRLLYIKKMLADS